MPIAGGGKADGRSDFAPRAAARRAGTRGAQRRIASPEARGGILSKRWRTRTVTVGTVVLATLWMAHKQNEQAQMSTLTMVRGGLAA